MNILLIIFITAVFLILLISTISIYTVYPVINILTRSGKREQCFKILKQSIKKQTYLKIRHIISNDNPDNVYLKNENDVYNVHFEKKNAANNCPYNHYLNILRGKVNSGWIIFIDDDAVFIDNNFVKNLANICKKSDANDIIVFDAYVGDKMRKFPIDFEKQMQEKNLIKNDIDMACFAIHKSCSIPFTKQCSGDYNFIKYAYESGYNLKYVKLPVGIWANYQGWSRGGNRICNTDKIKEFI